MIRADEIDTESQACACPPPQLVQLATWWERLSPMDRDLLIEVADDLSSLGHYNAAMRLVERTFGDGPDAMVVIAKARYQRLLRAAKTYPFGLIDGDLNDSTEEDS